MKKPDDLLVRAPDRDAHARAIYDLIGKTFAGEGHYWRVQDWCDQVLSSGSNHLDWDVSRIGITRDRVIANFTVWDYLTRVGKARLRTGGIGCVATNERFRKRGIISDVIASSLDAMRAAGYDITVLFGIPDFYHRFRYVRAWSDSTWEVTLDDMGRQPAPAGMRPLHVHGDREAARLYNRYHAALTGTAVRPTYVEMPRKGTIKARGWRDDAGKLLGYVRYAPNPDEGKLFCNEAVGPNPQTLGALAKLARKHLCRRIVFRTLPDRHPLLVELRRGDAKRETVFHRRAEAMIRVIDLTRCLASLAPELERRLRTSELAKWRGELLIADGVGKARLAIGKGGVTVRAGGASPHAIRGGARVAQFILGTDDPFEIVEHDRMRLSGDARRLLPVLFPAQAPGLSGLDRY